MGPSQRPSLILASPTCFALLRMPLLNPVSTGQIPFRLPPGVNLDDLVSLDPQPQPLAFKTPLKKDDRDEHFLLRQTH